MTSPTIRMGVDIGGTFTDVVLETPAQQYSAKTLTTYKAPENAIIDGIQQVCAKANINLSQIAQIIHGTTLATNALIQRRGAKTALITTEGFRDVIEMRTESRFEQYDLNLVLPPALLPRQQRYTVKERVNAAGDILIPLSLTQVESLAEDIKQAGYESVAIGLIHSYANPCHERQIREIFHAKIPQVMVSLSCEVSPQMREYERFNTVVANAYIKPLMKSYLSRLESQLQSIGICCRVFLMHSGGGIIAIDDAAEFPVRLVESGPAGGAVFAANIAARYKINKVLSFDMGGTTAKICLIKNYAPKTSRVFEVARTYRFKKGSGMPISIPVIDMVEIGAGGGSLARVDSMRQIRVGPESAGSQPGPACYARGGRHPAVTDADLVLGKLDANNFAGGLIPLSYDKAITALSQDIGDNLDMTPTISAYGLSEVVEENMANAARMHAVENGEDLAEYTALAFGGAAPLHAARLCEKLSIKRLLIPLGAGVGSAIGFLRSPFSFEANRSVFMRLSNFNETKARELFIAIELESTKFVRGCDAESSISCEFKVYMRYSGQGWEIPVLLTAKQAMNPNANIFARCFEECYKKLFNRTVEDSEIEITLWAVNAATPPPPITPIKTIALGDKTTQATTQNLRKVFDTNIGEMINTAVISRADLQIGQWIEGPAVITEDETTIIVSANYCAIKQPDGCIDIIKK